MLWHACYNFISCYKMNEILLALALSTQKGQNIDDNLVEVFAILQQHLPIKCHELWVKNNFLKNKKNSVKNVYTLVNVSVDYIKKGTSIVFSDNITSYFKNENSYLAITKENVDFSQCFFHVDAPALIIFTMGKHLFLKIFLTQTLQSTEKHFLNVINPIIQNWGNILQNFIKLDHIKKKYKRLKSKNLQHTQGSKPTQKSNFSIKINDENTEKPLATNENTGIENIKIENTEIENTEIENQKTTTATIQNRIFTEKEYLLLQTWLHQFHDAICITDKTGKIIFVNQEASSHFGYTISTLLNSNVRDVNTSFKSQTEWDKFVQHLQKKQLLVSETAHITPKGRIFPVEISAQYIYLRYENTGNINTENINQYLVFIAKDISDRQDAQNIILKKQIQLNSFINTVPTSVVMFDKNFNYVLGTSQWLHENNLKEYNILGKSYQEICVNYPAHWIEILKKCLSEGITERRKEEKIIIGKPNQDDPETKWVKWEFKPWYNNNTEIQGVIMLIEDINQRKYEADMLKYAKQKAEEASQAKHLFLANVSHEIRTPLHVMGGMMQLLRKTEIDPQQTQYLDIIKSAMDNLLVIVNDILDMSKIEAGKITLEKIGFDLRTLIQQLCLLLKHRAEEKGIGLFYEIDRRIAPILVGDPVRINQVLLNFVNNAIKFTNKGSVEIECMLMATTENSQKIVFRIIDTGKGITEHKLQEIFEKFTQEDETIHREFGGTGLGLSIAKQLTELMGGKIQVQSKRSIGTTFWFELDLPIGSENEIPKKQKIDTSLNQLLNMKILLAEDHDINRFLATTILQNWGIIVDIAENGREAVDKVTHNHYDAILMDIQMPIMGGLEATRIIRHQLKSDVPIIALTAHAFKGERERYISAGMNDYVSKPFEADELYTALLHFRKPTVKAEAPTNTRFEQLTANTNVSPINNNFNLKQPYTKNQTSENQSILQTAQQDYKYDLSILSRTLDNNEEMIKKMVDMFIQKTPAIIQELQQSLQQHDRNQVKTIAHKLKSSFKLMGMSSLADIALFLEQSALATDLATLDDNVKRLTHIFEVVSKNIEKNG